MSEQEIAVAQAVEFAQYVEEHAKGKMSDAARRFLSLPYAQDLANRIGQTEAHVHLQHGVSRWMHECFPVETYGNMTERGDRLLEEVLELLQSLGYDPHRVATLVRYVYGRPPGDPPQEVGGVMVTLAGYCWIAGLNMHNEGARELARITQPEIMARIRAKQEAKNAIHFDSPLPGDAAREAWIRAGGTASGYAAHRMDEEGKS